MEGPDSCVGNWRELVPGAQRELLPTLTFSRCVMHRKVYFCMSGCGELMDISFGWKRLAGRWYWD